MMKKIEAIIRPEKLDAVRSALEKAGCTGLMISEIEGHGKQKGVVQQWRGEKYKVELLPKIKIEVIVKDQDLEKITKTIIDHAKTGEIGDGKIFISSIENAIRIRTGERGEEAL
jgi:nitrogen regulatory protein P-II 1